MITTLLTGIGLLASQDDELGELADAALVIDGDRIGWIGPASAAPAADRSLELAGRCVLPGFVDSHAHLVFAGDRAAEFAARMTGQPYSAGGIRFTVEQPGRPPMTSSGRTWTGWPASCWRPG